jgi:hypothetical protein
MCPEMISQVPTTQPTTANNTTQKISLVITGDTNAAHSAINNIATIPV